MALPAKFLREAISEPLRVHGFSQAGRRQVWMRRGRGLQHAVFVYGSQWGNGWSVDWAVVEPRVGWILNGEEVDPTNVGYAGFIVGRASSHLPPPGVITHFERDDIEAKFSETVKGVALAASRVAEWMEEFATAGETVDRLLESPGDKHSYGDRLMFPVHWPLRLFTGAALAAVASDPRAEELTQKAIEALGPWMGGRDKINDSRIERLQATLR